MNLRRKNNITGIGWSNMSQILVGQKKELEIWDIRNSENIKV